jgi:hypothetical protein
MVNSLGYLFFGALLLAGICSGIGIFLHWMWSRTMILAKSAVILMISFLLLSYTLKPETAALSIIVLLCYVGLAAVETVAAVLASRQSLKDFLGIKNAAKLSRRAIIGSLLCMSNGVLLVLLELDRSSGEIVFTSISDTSIVCGMLIVVGGILILLRSTTVGAVISIIFGLFPPQSFPNPISLRGANHVFDLIVTKDSPLVLVLIAVMVASLPIVGGLLALSVGRRIRT